MAIYAICRPMKLNILPKVNKYSCLVTYKYDHFRFFKQYHWQAPSKNVLYLHTVDQFWEGYEQSRINIPSRLGTTSKLCLFLGANAAFARGEGVKGVRSLFKIGVLWAEMRAIYVLGRRS